MKRSSIVCQFALLAAVGCSSQVAPVSPTSASTEIESASTVQTDDSDTSMTFVSLKVPNMF